MAAGSLHSISEPTGNHCGPLSLLSGEADGRPTAKKDGLKS